MEVSIEVKEKIKAIGILYEFEDDDDSIRFLIEYWKTHRQKMKDEANVLGTIRERLRS